MAETPAEKNERRKKEMEAYKASRNPPTEAPTPSPETPPDLQTAEPAEATEPAEPTESDLRTATQIRLDRYKWKSEQRKKALTPSLLRSELREKQDRAAARGATESEIRSILEPHVQGSTEFAPAAPKLETQGEEAARREAEVAEKRAQVHADLLAERRAEALKESKYDWAPGTRAFARAMGLPGIAAKPVLDAEDPVLRERYQKIAQEEEIKYDPAYTSVQELEKEIHRVSGRKVRVDIHKGEDGKLWINSDKAIAALTMKYREEIAKENGFSSWAAIPNEVARSAGFGGNATASSAIQRTSGRIQQDLRLEAKARALSKISPHIQRSRNLVFFDPDPALTNKNLADDLPMWRELKAAFQAAPAIAYVPGLPGEAPIARRYVADIPGNRVFRAMNTTSAFMGSRIQLARESGLFEQYASGLEKFQAGDIEGAREDVLAGWKSAFRHMGGTDEETALRSVQLMREDPLVAQALAGSFEHAGRLMGLERETLKNFKRLGIGIGFPMDIVMPDPVTLGIAGGAVVGGKLLGRGARMARYARALEREAAVAKDYGDAASRLEKSSPELKDLMDMKVGHAAEIDQPVRARLRELEHRGIALQREAAEHRAKLKLNADDSSVAEDLARTEVKLRENDLEIHNAAVHDAQATLAAHRKDGIVAGITVRQAKQLPDFDAQILAAEEAAEEFLKKEVPAMAEWNARSAAQDAAGQAHTKAVEGLQGARAAKTNLKQAHAESIVAGEARLVEVKAEIGQRQLTAAKERATAEKLSKAKDAKGARNARQRAKTQENNVGKLKKEELTLTKEVSDLKADLRKLNQRVETNKRPHHKVTKAIKAADDKVTAAKKAHKAAQKEFTKFEETAAGQRIIRHNRAAEKLIKLQGKRNTIASSAEASGIDPYSAVGAVQQRTIHLESEVAAARKARKAAKKKVRDPKKLVKQYDVALEKERRAADKLSRAFSWKETFRETARQLRSGATALGKLDTVDPYLATSEILAKVLVTEDKSGTFILDSPNLRKLVEEEWGAQALSFFDRRMADVFPGVGEALNKKLHRSAFTADEYTDLRQNLGKAMKIAERQGSSEIEAMSVVEVLDSMRRGNPDRLPHWKDPRNFFKYIQARILRIYDLFDPIRAQAGMMSENMEDVVKMAHYLNAQIDAEMVGAAKMARWELADPVALRKIARDFNLDLTSNQETILQLDALFRYMDSVEKLPFQGTQLGSKLVEGAGKLLRQDFKAGAHAGSTVFNATQETTVWKSARELLLNERRVQRTSAALRAWERAVEEAYQEAVGIAEKIDLENIPIEEIKKVLPDLKDFLPPRPEPTEYLGKATLALSRMWLPRGVPTTSAIDGILYARMQKNAKNAESFQDFVRLQRADTAQVMAGESDKVSRATAMSARGAAHLSLLNRMDHLTAQAVGFHLPKAVTDDMSRLMSGQYGKIEDMGATLQAFARMGTPPSVQVIKPFAGKNASEVTVEFIRTGVRGEDNADSFFQLSQITKDIERGVPKVAKELEAMHASVRTPAEMLSIGSDSLKLRLWKQHHITGLIIPRPKYWINNIWGDFTQMVFTEGWGTAFVQSAHNLPTNIPYFGRLLQDAGADIARTTTARFGNVPVLGSAMNALLNPHLTNIWRGSKGAIRTRGGGFISYDKARKYLVEDGILDTFASEELMEQFTRLGSRFGMQQLREWSHLISSHANFTQQRQRAGLYLRFLQRGVSRSEARRRTLEALYDWKHGVAEWEIRTMLHVAPYYRFWRLAASQATSTLTHPIRRPGEAAKLALTGQSRIGRVRNLRAFDRMLPEFTQPEMEEGYRSKETQEREFAATHTPRWAGSSARLWVEKNPEYYNMAMKLAGQRVGTHNMTMMPPGTPQELANKLSTFALGLMGLGAAMLGSEKAKAKLVADWERQLIEPVADITYPWIKGGVEYALSRQGADSEGVKIGNTTRLSPVEYEIAQKSKGSLGWSTWRGPGGELRGHSGPAIIIRNFFPGAFKLADDAYFKNPEFIMWAHRKRIRDDYAEKAAMARQAGNLKLAARFQNQAEKLSLQNEDSAVGGVKWFLRGYLGFKRYSFLPEEDERYMAKDIERSMQKEMGVETPKAWQGYTPVPGTTLHPIYDPEEELSEGTDED